MSLRKTNEQWEKPFHSCVVTVRNYCPLAGRLLAMFWRNSKRASVRTLRDLNFQGPLIHKRARPLMSTLQSQPGLWAEQLWNGHSQKLDREIFEDCPSVKIGPLENFPLHGSFNLVQSGLCDILIIETAILSRTFHQLEKWFNPITLW